MRIEAFVEAAAMGILRWDAMYVSKSGTVLGKLKTAPLSVYDLLAVEQPTQGLPLLTAKP
jgi:hypothetical protein